MKDTEFTKTIKSRLAYKETTQKELAKFLHITEKTCAKYIEKPDKMPVWALKDIIKFLNLDAEFVLDLMKGKRCTN